MHLKIFLCAFPAFGFEKFLELAAFSGAVQNDKSQAH
jgi:hypothetical protein